ncbi:unnamed protein product, partial [Brachionus calyciflorus]
DEEGENDEESDEEFSDTSHSHR